MRSRKEITQELNLLYLRKSSWIKIELLFDIRDQNERIEKLLIQNRNRYRNRKVVEDGKPY